MVNYINDHERITTRINLTDKVMMRKHTIVTNFTSRRLIGYVQNSVFIAAVIKHDNLEKNQINYEKKVKKKN